VQADLTARQQQVLDYIASYVSDEGFLPTTREIAAACGLRSPTSARRALAVLEARGLLVRDPQHPRLVEIALPAGAPHVSASPDQELGLCELIMAEMQGAIEAARRALVFAPDLRALEMVHREALARIRLHGVYEEVRQRLLRGGARRSPRADAALRLHERMLTERLELVTSWDSYCLSAFLMRAAVHEFVDRPPAAGHRHLRHAYAAEVSLLGIDAWPELGVVAERLRAGDAQLHRVCDRYSEVFYETFAGIRPEIPALASPELDDAVTQSLDATLGPTGEARFFTRRARGHGVTPR